MFHSRSKISIGHRQRSLTGTSPLRIYVALVGVSLAIVTALSVLSLSA